MMKKQIIDTAAKKEVGPLMWLSPCFCCDNLYGGQIMSPEKNHAFACWLIVEHEDGEVYIRKQSAHFLVAGCSSISLYGAKADFWQAECMLPERTLVYSDLLGFEESLCQAFRSRPFVPTDYYLFYDDEKVCIHVLQMLKRRWLI